MKACSEKASFTPNLANKALPLVRKIVVDILEHGRELRELVQVPHEHLNDQDKQRIKELEAEVRGFFDELEQVGCSYRALGLDLGLVDFPSEIEGEAVQLCWRSDEDSVGWYHTLESGFDDRMPIPEELLGEAA